MFIIYMVVRATLVVCGLQPRAWINCICLSVVCLGFLAGFVQLYRNTKSQKIKLGLLIGMVISFVLLFFPVPIPFIYIFYDFATEMYAIPSNEHVVESEGYKFVIYDCVIAWDSEIAVYEYKNAFVSGSDCKTITSSYETDDDGRLIFVNWDTGAWEYIEDIMGD